MFIISWLKKFILGLLGYEMVYEEVVMRLIIIGQKRTITAFEYLKFIKKHGHLPMSIERPCTEATNSEIKRWLKNSSVIINGKKPNINDEIELPITELVFFSKGRRKTTYF